MYGLIRRDLWSLAYQLTTKNQITHPFQKETTGFIDTEGFGNGTLMTLESTSRARERAFNKPDVNKFYCSKQIQET